MPVTDFEEGSPWESAVLDPLPDEVPEEDRIPCQERTSHNRVPRCNHVFPYNPARVIT
jgi:hypothetical protein